MENLSPVDEVRRQWLIRALASGLFGAVLFDRDAVAADVFGGRPAKLPPGQSIYRITGKVLVNGVAASADTLIAATDTIETPPGGELVFAVGSHAMLVREDSRVALQAAAGSAALGAVEVSRGKVLSVFGAGEVRRLTTPTAAIEIKGTGVYIEADPEQTYFCTCYGVADVVAIRDPQSRESVKTLHHDKPLYVGAGASAGQNIRSAPFINHTDQELMLIETLVGRTPPFNFPGSQYKTPRPSGRYR
ncbi:MAG: hypothetical protein ABIQ60_02915 [Burkholderiaceae bacterium]